MKKHAGSDRPLIGITPDLRTARNGEPMIFLWQRYARAVLGAGALPFILPITPSRSVLEGVLRRLDGIVVSGGDFDIHPKHYGEKALEVLGNIKEERTEFELELISLALKRHLPVLGICGGAQAINVVLGGSLYQDIAAQIPSARDHQQGELKEKGGHPVKVRDGTRLRRIVGREILEVNSSHHQAVKKLGRGLIASATAEDGVVEGLESERHPFVVGVQWHPEFLIHRDPSQKKIFSALVSASEGPSE